MQITIIIINLKIYDFKYHISSEGKKDMKKEAHVCILIKSCGKFTILIVFYFQKLNYNDITYTAFLDAKIFIHNIKKKH